MKKEYNLKINGINYNVVVDQSEDLTAQVEVNGTPYEVEYSRPAKQSKTAVKPVTVTKPVVQLDPSVSAPVAPVTKPSVSGAGGAVKSPLPGVILSVDVNVGDTVKTGQKLLVLEAMKMENVIQADRDGKVAAIKVSKGDSVLEGAELVIIG